MKAEAWLKWIEIYKSLHLRNTGIYILKATEAKDFYHVEQYGAMLLRAVWNIAADGGNDLSEFESWAQGMREKVALQPEDARHVIIMDDLLTCIHAVQEWGEKTPKLIAKKMGPPKLRMLLGGKSD